MLKFAANLSLLWTELPYLERFAAAAEAGFEAVEVLFPYEIAAYETRRALQAEGLKLILINAPPPNYTGGARGFAALPEGRDRFRYDMMRVFRYVEVLRPRFLHVMTGEAEGEAAFETLVENIRWAADRAPEGLTLTLEPLNPGSMPGYFLNDYDLAARVIEAVALPNVGLQYDSFHAQVIHGDAVETFTRYLDKIVHVQIGDAPDRGPPGSGVVDFETLFATIDGADYKGWISAEYHPGAPTEETLEWFPRP